MPRCYCIIPRHSSTLEYISSISFQEICDIILQEDANSKLHDDKNDIQQQKFSICIISLHSEGVMWKGLLPLFSPMTSRRIKNCAVNVIMNHFHNDISHTDAKCAKDVNEDANIKCKSEIHESFHTFTFTSGGGCSSNNNPSILFIIPHYTAQYYSRTSASRPTNIFAIGLISYEKVFIQLTSISAYISTLGGGAFMCKYLSTAVALARQQCTISLLRGDYELSLKCRINEGYCYIHAGKFKRGTRVIRRVLRDVIQLQTKAGIHYNNDEEGLLQHTPEKELSELTIIKNMCYSALRLARLAEKKLKEDANCSHDNVSTSSTHDDYQRIRVARDRKWKG